MLPPASASPETQICGQRLSAQSAFNERLRPPIGDHRLKSLAPSGGNVGLFPRPGNYASSGRLPGSFLLAALYHRLRDIIPPALGSLPRPGWTHPIAAIIE